MDVPVYNMQGAEVGKMSIDENTLAASYSDASLLSMYLKLLLSLQTDKKSRSSVSFL